MKEGWKMVRVRGETHKALEKVKERYLRAAERGQRFPELDYRNTEPSIDWVIREMIREIEGKAQRSNRKRPKKEKTPLAQGEN